MIKQHDVAYFMASVDSLDEVTAFAEHHAADFPILSDESKETSKAFGVLSAIGFAKRWTFYIDTAGRIAYIDRNVNPGSAGPDLAARLSTLDLRPETQSEATQAPPEQVNTSPVTKSD